MSNAEHEVIPPDGGNAGKDADEQLRDFAGVAYLLYLLGLINGLTTLVGVIMVHLKAGEAKSGGWLESHFTWLARTFWITLLAGLAGIAIVLITFGLAAPLMFFIFYPLLWIWYVWRVAKGGMRFMDRKPVENPRGWV